jgi:hypothetical protein
MHQPNAAAREGPPRADEPPQPARPAPEAGPPAWGELALSAERWAFLAPKLRALLERSRPLEALERPDLEPAATGWRDDGAGDARR